MWRPYAQTGNSELVSAAEGLPWIQFIHTCTAADQDIGVIAPYRAQCSKIRTLLRAVADGVKVGSVEEFQGQVSGFMSVSYPFWLKLFFTRSEK